METIASQENDYVQFWNHTLAEKFERFRDILMNGLSHHSRTPLNKLHLQNGSKILDVGCGWGDTAIELAKKTGPSGYVLGLDCVDQFLHAGRNGARLENLENIEFINADVETYPFEAEFDLCFSRFGMMFFESPVAAMRNVYSALRPGGKLLFIVWRRIEDNPWFDIPKQVVLDFLPPPGDSALTCGPGPFSMANPDVVSKQLEIAGFQDITFERCDGSVQVGNSAENAMEFQLALGPAGEVYREAGLIARERSEEIKHALRESLAPFEKDGTIVMQSSSWAIQAIKPLTS